ncbi:class I SAM-dependent methyltransferase [Thiocystis violacea]|uniref:class I SAM-dependent methyltransferase n=1 Tax=Thiocystis violacea TaxID=13725 RepID=UPI001F5BA158|nr:class I SAM-dependent methyltransferase [Thiocystis violacea]
MTPLYERFLPLIPAGGPILDAGCGSGRDARAFRDLGYRVSAFDASPAMVEAAARHLDAPVQLLRFQDVRWKDHFDGIWACASLLHVPHAELTDALSRLSDALRPAGALYVSFKYGRGEREHKGRRFTDLDESTLAELLEAVPNLKVLKTWTTGDLRPGREAERWLNALLRKAD